MQLLITLRKAEVSAKTVYVVKSKFKGIVSFLKFFVLMASLVIKIELC